ncbi:ran-binding protein 6-like [Phoenix dactylifera]|uniref:Ran-binding protein 6-like n=1 Tax=Phoenix dactylifera TaxID=42345 RepID=A0A8B8ZSG4_PHODC|nr:ran-binding protein 6-like [Phoenix dactylifera]XP_038974458.1 ran-binding protein 6-like [Phoenix dactylifera]XP_038976026.1 ran-binding protein 6-like [Phoenix dactylifera]XP_038976060.1 ran-binding protein 6-like [Phoenix dactylifera]
MQLYEKDLLTDTSFLHIYGLQEADFNSKQLAVVAVMEVLMTLQGSQLETDDPITSYMLQAWARLCKCLGQDFLPYMNFVMPPLLQSAQLKPDVTITSADSDEDIDESDDDRFVFNAAAPV